VETKRDQRRNKNKKNERPLGSSLVLTSEIKKFVTHRSFLIFFFLLLSQKNDGYTNLFSILILIIFKGGLTFLSNEDLFSVKFSKENIKNISDNKIQEIEEQRRREFRWLQSFLFEIISKISLSEVHLTNYNDDEN
jgi:hypothetical protein